MQEKNKYNICALVVSYNRKKLLNECVESLLNQTFILNKIVIVDNASTDGTREFIDKVFGDEERIDYILLPENIGGAGGFAYGLNYLKSKNFDWIWIMDDDTIPDSNCLERLVDNTEVEKNISFLSSYVYGTDGNTMNVPEIELNSKSSNGCKDFLMHLDKKMIKISNATFVSILVNGEAVKKIGIPCDFFFIWGDDIEYTYRLTRFFGPAYLVGSSKALHKRKSGRALSIFEETDKRRIEFQKFGVRNSLIVGKEYFSKKKFAFIFLSKLKIFLKLVFSNTIEKKMKIKYFSLGIIDFLTGNYDKLAFKERLKK